MKKCSYFLFFVLIVLTMSSCNQLVYKVLLGVNNKPTWKQEDEINKKATEYNIPNKHSFVLDTATFYNGLDSIYKPLFAKLKTDKDTLKLEKSQQVRHDDFQPVQFLLFEKSGKPIFKIVNCYADIFPINWNIDNCLDTFSPKTEIESLNIYNYNLDFVLKNIYTFQHKKVRKEMLPKADFYGVLFWNNFMYKPSEKLINTVQKKVKEWNKSIVLLYVNNHNAFLWNSMSGTDKQKVKNILHQKNKNNE